MMLRQALYDRQSNRRYHTYPQLNLRKNSMDGVSKTFGGARCNAVFKMDADAFGQMRVSKALFQDKMHARQATGARGAAGQPANPASQNLP